MLNQLAKQAIKLDNQLQVDSRHRPNSLTLYSVSEYQFRHPFVLARTLIT